MRILPDDTTGLPPGFRWLRTPNGQRIAVPSDWEPPEPEPETKPPPELDLFRPAIQIPRPPIRPQSKVDTSLVATARAAKRPPGGLQLFTLDDLQQQVDRIGHTSDRDSQTRDKALLTQAAERGCWRKVAVPARTLTALDALAEGMPHFAGIVEAVRNQLLLAKAARKPPRLRPMLLVGPPGLGKSHFAERFAAALAVPIHRLAMDTVQTTSALSGGDSHWSNSQVGLVFQALALGPAANPVIVLDEIDKSSVHGGHDPLAPLHGLLEPLTAKHFADRSLPLPLDARHVVWIATANDVEGLDAPLRSRFAVHHIVAPDAQQALHLARAIARGLLSELQLRMDIPEAVFQCLTVRSPREQRQDLETAVAKAVAAGRSSLTEGDLPQPAVKTRRGIGFVWHD